MKTWEDLGSKESVYLTKNADRQYPVLDDFRESAAYDIERNRRSSVLDEFLIYNPNLSATHAQNCQEAYGSLSRRYDYDRMSQAYHRVIEEDRRLLRRRRPKPRPSSTGRVLCDLLNFDQDTYQAVRRLSAKWCARTLSPRRQEAPGGGGAGHLALGCLVFQLNGVID